MNKVKREQRRKGARKHKRLLEQANKIARRIMRKDDYLNERTRIKALNLTIRNSDKKEL